MRLETVINDSPVEMLKRLGRDVQVSVSGSDPKPLRAIVDRDVFVMEEHHGINENDMFISFLRADFDFEINLGQEITIDSKNYSVEKLDPNGAWLDFELLRRSGYA